MHISRETVEQERQMSSFGKYLSLIRAFVHGYYEVLIMKLNVWLDIPGKYIEYSCFTVSVAVDIFPKRLTDIFCKVFHFGFWYFSSYCIINWCKKCLTAEFFFPELACFMICVICLLRASWSKNRKTESCPFCS